MTNVIKQLRNAYATIVGETWNPMKLHFQMQRVRERVAKNLVEKSVCTTDKRDFIIIDMTTHPLLDASVKQRLVWKVHDALLSRWNGDRERMNRRLLSLVVLAQAAGVLEPVIHLLPEDDYELAVGRLDGLLDVDWELESKRAGPSSSDIFWAIYAAVLE